jgi:hypothetical protein
MDIRQNPFRWSCNTQGWVLSRHWPQASTDLKQILALRMPDIIPYRQSRTAGIGRGCGLIAAYWHSARVT